MPHLKTRRILIYPNRKKLKVNGLQKNKSSEFLQNLSCVCFTTNDLLLLRGTPEDRRSWLDIAISQIYPAYNERLSKYNKIKTQKNNIKEKSLFLIIFPHLIKYDMSEIINL